MSSIEIPGYELGALLGRGGAGEVWSARRRRDGLRCAVKVVAPLDGDTDQAVREAAVLERVRHEHVLRLYDVVPLAAAGGGTDRVALVLELAGGGSLAQVVAGRGHLTAGETVTVLSPLARTLADLHATGLTHGDLSPGNVLFDLDGKPLLSDLGVCRVAGEAVTGAFGADGFVAPEVLDGATAAPASDVYGIGALAWYCLTGAPAEPAIVREPLADLAPQAPEEMVELVNACLAVDPDARPEAMTVAVTMYDAADPEPVGLATGEDPALGLTHRIRAGAPPASAVDLLDPETAGPGAHREGDRRPTLVRALTGMVVVAVVALVVVVAGPGLGSWWSSRFDDGSGRGSSSGDPALTGRTGADRSGTGSPHTAGEPDGGSSGGGESDSGEPRAGDAAPEGTSREGTESAGSVVRLIRSSESATTRPVELLQALVSARADAWTSGRTGELRRAHAPGAPAMTTDRTGLELAEEQGVRYVDLAFTVRSAEVVRATDEEVRLDAVIDRSAYRVTGAQTVSRPAIDGEQVVVELSWTPEGWRIVRWS